MIRYLKILLLLFVSATAVTSSAQEHASNWNLKGKVKKITAEEWVLRDSAGNTVRKRRGIMSFGLNGKTTLFDTLGYIVLSTDNDSTEGKNTTYTVYNDRHETVSVVYLKKDGNKTTRQYVYESLNENRNGYSVDEKGRRTLVEVTVKDANNRTTQERYYSSPDTLSSTIDYLYDDAGHVIQTTSTYASGRKEVWSWQWKDGVKVQSLKTLYNKGKKESVTSYTYGAGSNPVREFVKHNSPSEDYGIAYEYTFDAQGNWLTRKMFFVKAKDRHLTFFAERSITYYE